MRISFPICKQTYPLLGFRASPAPITTGSFSGWRRKEKVVVVMGATGTGKSRLSIDLANRFPAEIINSDKMQVYYGLDILTNKVTEEEKCGIPHHLLGIVEPELDFTCSDFCHLASLSVGSIVARNRLPIIVGGSNSYIEGLIDNKEFGIGSNYEICFLWVDVSVPVLHSFVSFRVDQMIKAGLIDEVREIFDPEADYNQGIRRAIGVPELDRFLRAEAISSNFLSRTKLLEEAVNDIKSNTCKLACKQLGKIQRLKSLPGWNIHRIDATDVFLKQGRESDEAWERLVAGPSSMIVRRFLYDEEHLTAYTSSNFVSSVNPPTIMGTTVAAATL